MSLPFETVAMPFSVIVYILPYEVVLKMQDLHVLESPLPLIRILRKTALTRPQDLQQVP